MKTNLKISAVAAIPAAAMALLIAFPTTAAGIKTVSAKPTLATLQPGESVLFNDKSCPAGMIAKFTKAQKRAQMTKKCIHM